jgi:hypothetical protein
VEVDMIQRTSTLRSILLLAFLTFVALTVRSSAAAIKETTRLTIEGPGLGQPVQVTDERVLSLSNVFAGTFIGEPASEKPNPSSPRFAITFDVQTAQGVKNAAYVVIFAKSRWTSDAFIYLPGHGDSSYRRNISTILRDGQDGRWHHASEQWANAINAQLP